ncbi:isoprenoid synthase domain-containing protein [Flammula alnicola]|nr:isoprenoid synthase domain-containing protein [Flammula alnicola]
MLTIRPFPQNFALKNLAQITSRACALKVNPNSEVVDEKMREWFMSFKVYKDSQGIDFMDRGRFDIFAALSFPDADPDHLQTCLAFFFWAFATDDLSDEGEFQAKPDHVKAGVDICREIVYNQVSPVPDYPYATMLQDLFSRIRATATTGTCERFLRAFEAFSNSEINQSLNRSIGRMPSVSEFILARRATIGAALVEAMVEYSLDLNIPDHVFQDPIFMAMSDATTDMMTWPNDLCSLNKEQADGDLQNLVCCIMMERGVELQEGIDILTEMLDARVTEYLALKAKLPSFGPVVDSELAKYHAALENFVQGTVVWYYMSPRKFGSIMICI